jgi:hypothetical protein
MPPVSYPLVLYRGDSYDWQFRFWQDAGKTQPADLTGYTVRATMRGTVGSVPLACVIALPNVVTMTLAATTWPAMPAAQGQWDLQLTAADGRVQTAVAGPVLVTEDVTV